MPWLSFAPFIVKSVLPFGPTPRQTATCPDAEDFLAEPSGDRLGGYASSAVAARAVRGDRGRVRDRYSGDRGVGPARCCGRWGVAAGLLVLLLVDALIFTPALLIQAFNPVTTKITALALCYATFASPPVTR